MTTQDKLKERFGKKFPKTQKEATHYDKCACWSCNDYREAILTFIQKELTTQKNEIVEMIDIKDKEMKCVYGSCMRDCSHVEVARAKLRILKSKILNK